MQVPFLNLAAQHAALHSELAPAMQQALARAHFILGPEVEALEKEIAARAGTVFGVGVNSGSDALTLALRALEIGPEDEVITTPFTYIAPAEAIYQAGARIVFADIDPLTFALDPKQAARRVGPRTRAIIPVHLFGQAAPMEAFAKFPPELTASEGAKRTESPAEISPAHSNPPAREIHLIEDCAQAIGARRHDALVGGIGKAGCFSFYPTKNLGAAGDGGMVVTKDERLAVRLRMLRVHGVSRRYHHELHGVNSRLDELQAVILRVKLRHLDRWNQRRQQIAQLYNAALADLPLERPVVATGNQHVYHVYAILTDHRDALQEFLARSGVGTLIYYPRPLHLQQVYKDLNYREGDFPVAESVARRILPLPIYPELTDEQAEYVADRIRAFFAGLTGR